MANGASGGRICHSIGNRMAVHGRLGEASTAARARDQRRARRRDCSPDPSRGDERLAPDSARRQRRAPGLRGTPLCCGTRKSSGGQRRSVSFSRAGRARLVPMRVLLLHGSDSSPGGAKASFLLSKGCTLINPALPKDRWEESMSIAQDSFDRDEPKVVVGGSRGGALAMNLRTGNVPLVLSLPLGALLGALPRSSTTRSYCTRTPTMFVPLADSRDLVARSGLPASSLVIVGADHRMSDAHALAALWRAVAGCAA